jgi:hypothetical protein
MVKPSVRGASVNGWRRRIDHIAPEEIATAVRMVLISAVGIHRDDLIVAVARAFEFSRTGDHVASYINSVIGQLIDNGSIRDVDGKLSLIDPPSR